MNKPLDFPITGFDADHEITNHSGNASLMDVLDARLSRRAVLRGGVGTAATALLGGLGLSACGGSDDDPVAPPAPVGTLAFGAVAKSTADVVTVAAGYTASVVIALGDPILAGTAAFKNDGTDGEFDKRSGDHHDGMEYFGLGADGKRDSASNARGLLVTNHEATSHNSSEKASAFVHANGGTNTLPRPLAEIDREIPLHGVSIVEVKKTGAAWTYEPASAFNRRVTPLTPVELSGPARGNALLKTLYSTAGTGGRGTLNNCGSGYSPWGSYLTGEENWAGYFTRSATDDTARADKSVTSLKRYNRNAGAASRHGWEGDGSADQYARWNIGKTGASADGSDDYRNELNTFGYVVEIDPYDKAVAIKKRTALGRFAHESASFSKLTAGKPLAVYMGDDSRGEYIYKFVSAASWDAADANPSNRIATGDKYLDSGKLYVAKFNADGTGAWLELNVGAAAIAGYAGYTFADQADVLVNARLAADALGATKMDRPEWCAVHPSSGEIYYTLTNNSNRKVEPVPATVEIALDAPNPRAYADSYAGGALGKPGNINGHILRMAEVGGETAAISFTWDVYLFGAQSDADATTINLSALTADQDFSSPDGLWFSQNTGLCWIQTDDGSYTDATNCMMLAAVPGKVGDGVSTTLSYTKADGSAVAVKTYVGKKPAADTLKRFLVGPVDCEITGCTETPDGQTLFMNIQHPGETITSAKVADPANYLSHWPGNAGYGAGGATARPRSATIAIVKTGGGRIGT